MSALSIPTVLITQTNRGRVTKILKNDKAVTTLNPIKPNRGFGMPKKAAACSDCITGEQDTIGLKEQDVTWLGSVSRAIFSSMMMAATTMPDKPNKVEKIAVLRARVTWVVKEGFISVIVI